MADLTRREAQLLQRATGADACGQPLDLWTVAADVWTSIRHRASTYPAAPDQAVGVVRTQIQLRARAGIEVGMRVQRAGRQYVIQGVMPDTPARGQITLDCELLPQPSALAEPDAPMLDFSAAANSQYLPIHTIGVA